VWDYHCIERVDMAITINNRKYAKNSSELLDSLFQGPVTAHGLYKVKRGKGRVAIELRTIQGEPKALISPDGVFVTAFSFEGKTRYMYGLTEDSKEFLGFQSIDRKEQFDMAVDALAAVILA
jgi:hypothetical protein